MFAEFASDAPSVSPEIDVQTGTEAVPAFLADFDKPKGALSQSSGIAPFGHQNDRINRGLEYIKKFGYFIKIRRIHHDEL